MIAEKRERDIEKKKKKHNQAELSRCQALLFWNIIRGEINKQFIDLVKHTE